MTVPDLIPRKNVNESETLILAADITLLQADNGGYQFIIRDTMMPTVHWSLPTPTSANATVA